MITLQQHLEEHPYSDFDDYEGWESCECGWSEKEERLSESGSVFTHAAHVAQAWEEARMSAPDFVLWPLDGELWRRRDDGSYESLDGLYTRSLAYVMRPEHHARILWTAVEQ